VLLILIFFFFSTVLKKKKNFKNKMSEPSILLTIVGLVVIAGIWYNRKNIEHFGMIPAQVIRVEQVQQMPQNTPISKGSFFMTPGTYQATLNPRQAGMVNYGPYIRYDPPEKSKRADSMGSLEPIQEGYCGVSREGFQADLSSNQQVNPIPAPADLLIAPNSGLMTTNALGEQVQPIIYDRFIFANQKDRLRQDADFIRGDLPIIPLSKGWFSPSANPQTALRDGALMVIGGQNNTTSKELAALKSAALGNIVPPSSSMPIWGAPSSTEPNSTNYAVQSNITSNAAGGDIQITRFP
jgi:hypothetical protein